MEQTDTARSETWFADYEKYIRKELCLKNESVFQADPCYRNASTQFDSPNL